MASTSTTTIRAPREVKEEVAAAAQVLGCSSASLVRDAWNAYRATPEFAEQFADAQQAFIGGDLDQIVERLNGARRERARSHAARVASMRDDG